MIVSNSSPLISLSGVGQIDILRRLYRQITIPKAVWKEVVTDGVGLAGAHEVQRAKWIEVVEVGNHSLVIALKQNLHVGEAEAIALTVEHNAKLLLLDDMLARTSASLFKLKYIGTLGVLREAKEKNVIQKVKPVVEELRGRMGFWLEDKLIREFLRSVGE